MFWFGRKKETEAPSYDGLGIDEAPEMPEELYQDPKLKEFIAARKAYLMGIDYLMRDAASYYRSYNEGMGKKKAVALWALAACQGNAEAQYELGVCFRHGEVVSQNNLEAAKWWARSAKQGYSLAQHNLAMLYSSEQGVPRNMELAVKLYGLAAEQGLDEARLDLGSIYAFGQGVKRDVRKAIRLWKAAGENGCFEAWLFLMALFNDPKDRKAADKATVTLCHDMVYGKEAEELREMAQGYLNRSSNAFSVLVGLTLLHVAADKNDGLACMKLALYYGAGEYVVQDSVKAAYYLMRAKECGK